MDDGDDSVDIFLSYGSLDRDLVLRVAEGLRSRGASVLLDRWYLAPGVPWPEALQKAIGRCRAVAVFIGPHGMGSWQQREKCLALERLARERGFVVVPVLLPGAEPALELLHLDTWVDLSGDPDDGAALDRLAAVVGAPGGTRERAGADEAPAICPYRGLGCFREEDAPLFFGRTAFAARLAETVLREPLVAVVGASGSGKSSVVRAGLLPQLRRGAGAQVWEIVTVVPGDRPLHALAGALVPLLEPGISELDHLAAVGKLAGELRSFDVALRDIVERALDRQTGTTRLLLLVDQWEELYTLASEPAALAFVDQILDAAGHAALSTVLTLRADFFGRVLAYRPLADALQDRVANLGSMTRAELEEAIAKPALQVGLAFEEGLVSRILDALVSRMLDDVGEEPGDLPLLGFVLAGLWARRDHGCLRHAAYESMGGLQGAMARRAEEACAALSGQDESLLRRVLLQLVRAGGESVYTRRRATASELGEDAVTVVEELARGRLVVTGRDEASGEQTVEMAHEALIHHWARLRGWLEAERELLAWRQRLGKARVEWERTRRDKGALLHGALLAEAERWLAERGAELAPAEREYVTAATALRRRRRALEVAGVGLVVLLTTAIAVDQYRRAEAHLAKHTPFEPDMLAIDGGEFEMGAPDSDLESLNVERPVHSVQVRAFRLARTEVTVGEYERFVLATGARWPGDIGFGEDPEPAERRRRPIINVSFDEAEAYAQWLSRETGKSYRLPTEAEWEYAARAGTTTPRFWQGGTAAACSYANVFDKRSEPTLKARYGSLIRWSAHPCEDAWVYTAPVGAFEPNAWGLHDMLGNVWEWTADCWHGSYKGAPRDGYAWREVAGGDCAQRVVRGGSWGGPARFVRSSNRDGLARGDRLNNVGFRLAQDR